MQIYLLFHVLFEIETTSLSWFFKFFFFFEDKNILKEIDLLFKEKKN